MDSESEVDPLLCRSPDSTGSSVDLHLSFDRKGITPSMQDMTSLARTLNSPDFQSSSINVSCSSLSKNVGSPTRSLASPPRDEIFEPGGDSEGEILDGVNNGNGVFESNGGCIDEVTDDNFLQGRQKTTRQFSVDYFDSEEYESMEMRNPALHNIPEGGVTQSSLREAATTGLNQSTNSLSDNHSYQYGNQTEYCVNGDYRNHFYDSPLITEIYNTHYNHRLYYDQSPSCVPILRRYSLFNDEVIVSNQPSEGFDGANKLSLSRMHSSDSYFKGYKQPHTSLNETKSMISPVTEEGQTGIRSEIVPLSVYKSGSVLDDEQNNSL